MIEKLDDLDYYEDGIAPTFEVEKTNAKVNELVEAVNKREEKIKQLEAEMTILKLELGVIVDD